MHTSSENQDIFILADCRPDLVVFESASRDNVELDIALAHPWSSDTFPKSAEIYGAPAKWREERKHFTDRQTDIQTDRQFVSCIHSLCILKDVLKCSRNTFIAVRLILQPSLCLRTKHNYRRSSSNLSHCSPFWSLTSTLLQ